MVILIQKEIQLFQANKMSEVKGKIMLIGEPNEFPKDSGNYNVGIKLSGHDQWFNRYDELENLKQFAETIKKGYEVKLKVDQNKIQEIEIISAVEEKKSGKFDDMTNYEDLLNAAHKKAKEDDVLLSMVSKPVEDGQGDPMVDFKNKTALYQATLIIRDKMGTLLQEISDTGDAEGIENQFIKPHFNRMASTRAMARCYRIYTNNAKVAVEETGK